MSFKGWDDRVRRALEVELDYDHRRLQPELQDVGARLSAVLLLLRPLDESDAALVLTKRSEQLEQHRGQIAFPGGVTEPGDLAFSPAYHLTALREAEEEIGLPRERVEIIGELPELRTPTRFLVNPVVGLLRPPFEEPLLRPNPVEIAEIFWVSLSQLTAPGVYRLEQMTFQGRSVGVHVYQVGPHRIWGATGAMIHNFLQRLFVI